MTKKQKVREVEPRHTVTITHVYEAVCPECDEVAKDSTGHQGVVGNYFCERCSEEFRVRITPTKKDGRGVIQNKEIVRGNIIRILKAKDGVPVTGKELKKSCDTSWRKIKKNLDNLEEENLAKRISKGWVIT